MRAIPCLVLFNIIGYTQTKYLGTNLDKKSVNLELETVLEFDRKDNAADVKVIENVQKFLNKIIKVLVQNDEKPSRRQGGNGDEITFKDFLLNSVVIIKSYKDDDLRNLIDILGDEIRKYHYRGSKFHELARNAAVRGLVSNKLEKIRSAPIPKIRKKLDKFLKKLQQQKLKSEDRSLLDYINSLYKVDASPKLRRVLGNLQSYAAGTKRSNSNLVKIIRDGLRSLVFDHFSNLRADARKGLTFKVEAYYNFDKADSVNINSSHSERAGKTTTSKPKYGSNTYTDSDEDVEEHTYHKIKRENLNSEKEFTTKRTRNRFKRTSTISDRIQTLWEEPRTISKKHKKKRKSYLRLRKPEVREIIAEHNAVIEVVSSTSASQTTSHKPVMRHKKASPHKPVRTHKSAHRLQKRRERKLTTKKPTRTKSVKRNIELAIKTSDEGLSIDHFEADDTKHGFRKQNDNDRFDDSKENFTSKEDTEEKSVHSYVLNKLSNLEKAMADVKHQMERNSESTKMNTAKPTTNSVISTDTIISVKTTASTRDKSNLQLENSTATSELNTGTEQFSTSERITQADKLNEQTETENDVTEVTTALTSIEETTDQPTVAPNASTTTEGSAIPVFRASSFNESNEDNLLLNGPNKTPTQDKDKEKNLNVPDLDHELNETWMMDYLNKTMAKYNNNFDGLQNANNQTLMENSTLGKDEFESFTVPSIPDDIGNMIATTPPEMDFNELNQVDNRHILNSLNSSRRFMKDTLGMGYDDEDSYKQIEEGVGLKL